MTLRPQRDRGSELRQGDNQADREMPIPNVSGGDSISRPSGNDEVTETERTAVARVTHRGGQQQGPCGADAVAARLDVLWPSG